MRRTAFVSAMALGAVFVPFGVHAQSSSDGQDTPPQAQVRETVTVTAERLEVPLERSGSAVDVLTAEDLEALGVHWLSDAVATVPGVVVARSGGPGTVTSVFLRGANSNHTLVLIDGVKVNSPSTGAYDFSALPVAGVERVEIVLEPELSWRLVLEDGEIAWLGTEDGRAERVLEEPGTSWWLRSKVWMLGLLPIEGQL